MSQQVVEQAEPFLAGNFAPVPDELDADDLPVTGRIPDGFAGAYVRNGANPAFPPLGRYHWFDGDGMVHGVTFEDGKARYRNRWVRTAGLAAEREAGRALFGGINDFRFPEPELLALVGGPFKNAANTALVHHAGKLLALWEGGFPHELNLDLETVGLWDFCGALTGSMTAHPKVDPVTGEMFFFGYSQFPPYLRYHVVDADGRLVASREVDLPAGVMIHDFVITDRHAVFLDAPAVFDLEASMSGGSAIRWAPENGCRIGVLPRDGSPSSAPQWFEIDPCFVFHFMNAWADGDRITIVGARFPRLAMPGDVVADAGPANLARFTVDLATGRAGWEQLDDRAVEFPRIDDRRTGRQNRFGVAPGISPDGDAVSFDRLVRYDLSSGTATEHVPGPGRVPGEASFVPDPGRPADDEEAGWYVTFVYDRARDTSDLEILDAGDLSAGPVATVHLPRRVPFGFHGTWVPAQGA